MLAFLASPLGRVVAFGAALLAVYAIGHVRGGDKAEARCEAAALRAQLETVKHDLSIQKDIADLAQRELGDLEQHTTDLNKKVTDYETALAKNDACRRSPADTRRLRALR